MKVDITKEELKARVQKVTQRQVDKFIVDKLIKIDRFGEYIDYENYFGDETYIHFKGIQVMNAIKEAIVLNKIEAVDANKSKPESLRILPNGGLNMKE